MGKTKTATPTLADRLDAVIVEAEARLRDRLDSGGDLLALEAAEALLTFRRVAEALHMAVLAPAPPETVVSAEDRADFTTAYVREALGGEAEVVFRTAEARANRSLVTAREQWKSYLAATEQKRRWAGVYALQQRGRR